MSKVNLLLDETTWMYVSLTDNRLQVSCVSHIHEDPALANKVFMFGTDRDFSREKFCCSQHCVTVSHLPGSRKVLRQVSDLVCFPISQSCCHGHSPSHSKRLIIDALLCWVHVTYKYKHIISMIAYHTVSILKFKVWENYSASVNFSKYFI